MKLTITKLKVVQAMSEETLCFCCTLLADGKEVGHVENTGKGAPNRYQWTDRGLGQQVEQWAAAQPTEFQFEKLDQLVDALVALEDQKKFLARQCRTKVLFRLAADKRGEWRTIKGLLTADVAAHLAKKYGDAVQCIVNRDGIEAACQYC